MSPPYRFIAIGVMAWATPAGAATADGFDVSGTVRLRLETIGNQPRAGFNRDDSLVSLRTTVLGKYQSGGLVVATELWDSRVYGGNAGTPVTTGEVNAVELVQAYVGLDGALGRAKVHAQAGRFVLNIGSRRLVASDDYRNTTNGYTGVKVDVTGVAGAALTAIYVLPQQRRPDDPDALRHNAVAPDREGFDLVLWGGTVAKAKAIGVLTAEATFYHLGEDDRPGRPTRDRALDTYGGRVVRPPSAGHADVDVEAFYQSGSISASPAPGATRLPVSAWFVHGGGGYTFAGGWRPRVAVEYDRASGDGPGGGYGRFDTLYGMRRADFAPGALYSAVGRANVSTAGARVEVTPSPRWDAFATYHALWLADRTDSFSTSGVRDATGKAGAFAGHQLDARVRWWVRPATLRLEFDGVLLAKGRFLRDAANAPGGGTTAYASINLAASF